MSEWALKFLVERRQRAVGRRKLAVAEKIRPLFTIR
jgi:hypothetical protein